MFCKQKIYAAVSANSDHIRIKYANKIPPSCDNVNANSH